MTGQPQDRDESGSKLARFLWRNVSGWRAVPPSESSWDERLWEGRADAVRAALDVEDYLRKLESLGPSQRLQRAIDAVRASYPSAASNGGDDG